MAGTVNNNNYNPYSAIYRYNAKTQNYSYPGMYGVNNQSNYINGKYSPYRGNNNNLRGQYDSYMSSLPGSGTNGMGANNGKTLSPMGLLSLDMGIDSTVSNINNLLGTVGLNGVSPLNLTSASMANMVSGFFGGGLSQAAPNPFNGGLHFQPGVTQTSYGDEDSLQNQGSNIQELAQLLLSMFATLASRQQNDHGT